MVDCLQMMMFSSPFLCDYDESTSQRNARDMLKIFYDYEFNEMRWFKICRTIYGLFFALSALWR